MRPQWQEGPFLMEPLAPSFSLSREPEPWGVEGLVVLTPAALTHTQLYPQGPQAMRPSPRSHCVSWSGRGSSDRTLSPAAASATAPATPSGSCTHIGQANNCGPLCLASFCSSGRLCGPVAPVPSLTCSNLSLQAQSQALSSFTVCSSSA